MTTRISIVSKFKRTALNIGEQSDRLDFHKKYLPTWQAENFVEDVAVAVQYGGGAHALSGAYGAGKSSLAIFAMNQLCCKTKSFAPAPFKLRNKTLERRCKDVQKNGGMLGIAVVGSAAPLARRIIDGTKQVLSDYAGTPPESLKKITAIRSLAPDNSELLSLLGCLADDLRKHRKTGVLLLIDEFGRHLERMAALQDASDMHLLQGLAEMTGTRKSAFSLVIIQHYGMEHYSRRLLGSHRLEWEKTRGRFKETCLENTVQDVADIVASLFTCRDKPDKKAEASVPSWIRKSKMFQLAGKGFAIAALQCWPMHPATIAVLAQLSTNLGQNDRTVIGWITSASDSGFKHAAERAEGWVYPASLFRHFFGNSQNLPVNRVWARRVSEICAADERFDGDDNALMLMQTVAVLNCVGGGIANEKTLRMCLPKKFPFGKALSSLSRQSLIIYRKHRGEYCVWQGSDYDFIGSVIDASERIGNLSLAAELNRPDILPEIIAYRHLIETGNLRVLPVEFVDAGKSPLPAKNADFPRALVYLTDDNILDDSFESSGKNDVCTSLLSSGLTALCRESAALRMLLATDYRLQEDATARNEIEQQLQFVGQQITDAVSNAVYANDQWQYGNETWVDIQSAASVAMEKTYSKGFDLHNELINRDRSSGAITAALRALCAALVESVGEKNLGIKKHPPHLLIYKTFLQEKGLHVPDGETFRLVFDSEKVSKDLRPVVRKMEELLFPEDSSELRNIHDMMDCLTAPPFGVKRLPALILCVVCMLYHRDKLALYENKEYVHIWGRTTLERLLGAPSLFALAPVLPVYADDILLAEYHRAVGGDKDAVTTVIAVARTLLVRYDNFDFYGRYSDSVSEHAKEFRRAVINAKSPSDLLFKNLPIVLDGVDFVKNKSVRRKYFQNIARVLDELSGATTALLDHLGEVIRQHYGYTNLHEALMQANKDARTVLSEGRMYPVHKRFLHTLQDRDTLDEVTWLKHIAMSGLDAAKSPKYWTDADEAAAEFALRHNLLWLQNATALLRKNQDDKFFITVDMGVAGDPAPIAEVNHIVESLKKRLPPDVLPKAMAQINYHLYKEDV